MLIYKDILVICTILIAAHSFLSVSCTNVIQKWTFERNTNYSKSGNIQPATEVISQSRQSIIQCNRDCVSDNTPQCQRVQFKDSSGTCELLASAHDEVGQEVSKQEEGWNSYKIVQSVMYPDTDILSEAFRARIALVMRPGRAIYINGVFKVNPNRMTFQLNCEDDGDDDIALIFDVRFNHLGYINMVIRNTWINGGFGYEEQEPSRTNFPFSPGTSFEIKVIAETTRFQIFVDNVHFVYFNYRVTPVDRIRIIGIVGDATLNNVTVQ